MRHRGRTDANQKAVVAALRAAGCSVLSLANIGSNAPDLLVGFRGVTYLLEVKNPEVVKTYNAKKREAMKSQALWHQSWQGTPPVFVHSPEEALKAVGL